MRSRSLSAASAAQRATCLHANLDDRRPRQPHSQADVTGRPCRRLVCTPPASPLRMGSSQGQRELMAVAGSLMARCLPDTTALWRANADLRQPPLGTVTLAYPPTHTL
jgi:hypothetical protein